MGRKAGERLAQQARGLRTERRNLIGWRYIPAALIYCAVCSLFIVYLSWSTTPEITWMFAGFAGGASLLFLWVATDTVSASRLESAGIAEGNTSSEVRKLKRHGWRVVDNIPFEKYDVDHVAIGPGGIILLETKWTSDGLFNNRGQPNQYGDRAMRQVARNVIPINGVLRQNGFDGTVSKAVVVAWGARNTESPYVSVRPDCTIVDGDQLGDLLSDLDHVLSTDQIEAGFAALSRFVSIRLQHMAMSTSAG